MRKMLVGLIFLVLCGSAIAAHNVATPYELWNMRNDLADTFTQTANIDLAVTNPASHPAAYDGGTSYSIGDMVTHTHGATEQTYFSLTNTNQGNDPTDSDTANWRIAWVTAEGWLPIGTLAAQGSRSVTCSYSGPRLLIRGCLEIVRLGR
jgi:hypothetical protein